MKPRTRHIYGLIITLIVVGISVFLYRHIALDVPLSANKTINSWTIEANLKFIAERDRPVQARLAIPYQPLNYAILDEYFISPNYGVMTHLLANNRQAVWSQRRSSGAQSLYYRAIFREADNAQNLFRKPNFIKPAPLPENLKAAADAILTQARQSSADIETFVQSTIHELNRQDGNAKLLMNGASDDKSRIDAIITVLNQANIEAIAIQGLLLKQDTKTDMKKMLAVFNGQKWLFIHPETAVVGLPKTFLIWQFGDMPLVHLTGGKKPQISFSVTPTPMNALSAAKMRGLDAESKLIRFSLLDLPVHIQETYKILLMVPVGAFIILLLRQFIGLKTFGTFMPVLIALAFRETQLIWGVFLFAAIVSMGLLVRFYLNALKLMMVPRLTVILTIVILLMLIISTLSQNLDLSAGLSVALFPMIILTMTIERMCVLWDERGALEAIQGGLGSLLAAVCIYLVINIDSLQYILFAFPELLFVLLGVTIAVGEYRGYRITELLRFHALAEQA